MSEKIIILAGVHGEEIQSSFLLEDVCKDYKLYQEQSFTSFINSKQNIIAIPRFNIFGLAKQTRGNKNQVDLNRNLPSRNWSHKHSHPAYYPGTNAASEQETKDFLELLKEFEASLIISIHTNHFVTVQHPAQINFDGQENSQGFFYAQKLAKVFNLELTQNIGYPTPGSLGSYAKEINIPCITIELEHELSSQEIQTKYSEVLTEYLKTLS
jgi:protein MpaA